MLTIRNILFSLLLLSFSGISAANDLLGALTSQLGVTQEQASGGAGAMFNTAKSSLSADDFAKIADVVPGIGDMMKSAPSVASSAGGIAGAASMLGGSNSSMANVAGLASSFSDLGLSADMVTKFTPIVLDYLKGEGGTQVMNLMKNVL